MSSVITRNSFIETTVSKKFYIKACDFGKGLFANVDIKKGEEILLFTGALIDFDQAVAMGDKQGNALQIGYDLYLDTEEPARFVNHSCEPNAGIKNNVVLVAIKDITKGEEVYFDYSTTMDEDEWTMECGCGNKNCRKIIKDFKYLPVKEKRKYLKLNVVQHFIASQYQEMLTGV